MSNLRLSIDARNDEWYVYISYIETKQYEYGPFTLQEALSFAGNFCTNESQKLDVNP